MEKSIVYNKPVKYEKDAEAGVWHLKRLSPKEAKVFFDAAWLAWKNEDDSGAPFEDLGRKNYTLVYHYNSGDWYYVVTRRRENLF